MLIGTRENIDLFTWTLREVIPRFPGMLAAGSAFPYPCGYSYSFPVVFMINYSWAHSGLWSIAKSVATDTAYFAF